MTTRTQAPDDEWRYELADIMTEFAERLTEPVPREKTSTERKVHLAAIQKITDRWLNGEISTAEKREQIARENVFWYGREKRSPATGELLTAAGPPGRRISVVHAPPDPDPWGEDDEDDDAGLEWWQK